jgi:hypothetical protein
MIARTSWVGAIVSSWWLGISPRSGARVAELVEEIS